MFWLHLPEEVNQSSRAARIRQCAIEQNSSTAFYPPELQKNRLPQALPWVY
jgi:hypothetical protein